jgi:two-component system phosphate regulon response regulator PhoB
MSDWPSPTATSDEPFLELDATTFSVRASGRLVPVTAAEFDLLAYLVANQPRVLGHAELAREVFGATSGDTALLVRVHICHVRRALGDAGRLIETVRRRGYRLVTGASRSSELNAKSTPA